MDGPIESAPALDNSRNPQRNVALTPVLLSLGILVVGTFFFFLFRAPPDQRVVWLTPAEFRQSTQPGPFTRIKYDIINLTGPLFRRFLRFRPQINIDSSLMALSAAASEATDLGKPTATNAAGLRAWVLSPNDLQSFQARLKSIPEAAVVSRPRISTANSIQSQLFVGESPLPGSTSIPVGLRVDIMPKVANGTIRLLVCVVSTERVASPQDNFSLIRTNISVSCEVSLPSGGALAVDAGPAKAAGGTNYWFIISPTAIDASGKPIKL